MYYSPVQINNMCEQKEEELKKEFSALLTDFFFSAQAPVIGCLT